jgi:ribosomal-protein-alanine N-acetyltransferase
MIRRMTKDDIPDVFKIESELFPDPWPANAFLTEIKQKKTSFPYVVEKNDKVIGYIICWYYHDELHIGNIAITKTEQNKGIGKYLLDMVFEYFKDYRTAFLEVREKNKKAINLYESYGFEIAYKRHRYYPNGDNALVMVKIKE